MEYLLRLSKYKSKKYKNKKSVAHLWNGVDTFCHMFSTGGFATSEYVVSSDSQDRTICQLCEAIRLRVQWDEARYDVGVELQ